MALTKEQAEILGVPFTEDTPSTTTTNDNVSNITTNDSSSVSSTISEAVNADAKTITNTDDVSANVDTNSDSVNASVDSTNSSDSVATGNIVDSTTATQDTQAATVVKDGTIESTGIDTNVNTNITNSVASGAGVNNSTTNNNSAAPAVSKNTAQVKTISVTDETEQYVSPMEGRILATIRDYMAAMAPGKPVREKEAAQHQVQFYRALQMCIEQQTDDFTSTFKKIHQLFHKHRAGVFAETHVYRYTNAMNISESDAYSFVALVNMIKLMADPVGRSTASKQIDLNRTLRYISEEGRQRVMHFYLG